MAIIKVSRSDDTSAFVLLNIEDSEDHSLTAKIVGTDGVGAFVLQLRHALAARALAPKSSCNAEEWTSILKSVLLDGLTPEDIEVSATVDDEKTITVVFRKTFEGGLKQRLGSLTLKYDAEEEIEIVDWCAALAVHASQQARELQREKEKVRKLVKETDELVKAKEEAEKEVMSKCLRLVNSKKEKIQELQERLSRYEKGDPPVGEPMQVEEVEEEEAPQPAKRGKGKAAAKGKGKAKPPSPVKSTLPRRGKRAAPEPEPEDDEEEEEEEPAKEEDVDMGEEEVETEGETEGEDTPSDRSVEDEVPEVRKRAESQTEPQSRRHGGAGRSRKDVSPPKEVEHEAPHVATRSHDKSHKTTAKDDGSETESDDEL